MPCRRNGGRSVNQADSHPGIGAVCHICGRQTVPGPGESRHRRVKKSTRCCSSGSSPFRYASRLLSMSLDRFRSPCLHSEKNLLDLLGRLNLLSSVESPPVDLISSGVFLCSFFFPPMRENLNRKWGWIACLQCEVEEVGRGREEARTARDI